MVLGYGGKTNYLVRSQRKWALPERGKLWEKVDKAPVLGHVRWQLLVRRWAMVPRAKWTTGTVHAGK